ncbi:MAG: hypothetical protein MUF15_22490 [Acidobacteria bacterium]|jgi:hypothetical protein|nr:hypothetical protein [Acidobacteriota bacterium]
MKDMMKVNEHKTGKILSIIFFIVLMLAAARLINQTVWWNMIKLEIKNNPATAVTNYSFLGLSGYNVARDRLTGMINQKIREVTIVSYFDFIHPAVFLVHSRSRNALVNMGILNLLPGKGFIDCFFFPSEIIKVRATQDDRTNTEVIYYGASLFPQLYWSLARRIEKAATMADPVVQQTDSSSQSTSFLLNPIEKATYLKIPYYFHFYFPLLLILILTAFYGKAFCIAFFYYLELFLLFDFRKVMFTVPFSWFIDLTGMNISPTAATVLAAALTFVFTICAFAGISHINKKRKEKFGFVQLTAWGKGLIFFFILLPWVIRF